MSKLRAAVIGCGGAGRNHAIGYSRSGDVELVGFADIDPTRADALASEFGGAAYASYEDMIAAVRPDIVSVCTREYDHVEPTLYALANGSHVMCEKIMAHRLEFGEQMVTTAEVNNKLLSVNYNYRFIDSAITLKEHLEAGSIGEIRRVHLSTHGYCHHHTLDLIRFLFGEPEEITATLTEDQAERNYPWNEADHMLYIPSVNESTVLRIGKVLVTLNSGHRSLTDYPLIEMECIGTDGAIKVSEMMIDAINGRFQMLKGRETSQYVGAPLTLDDIFFRSIAAWVEAVQGKRPVSSSGRDGLQVMRLEAAISQSNREKRAIRLV